MAHAVKELFPEAKLAIGPAIEDGFYYDFDLDRSFARRPNCRGKKMSEIIKRNTPFVRKIVKREEAIDLFNGKR
jgi:threonyl-tRNA synthetase